MTQTGNTRTTASGFALGSRRGIGAKERPRCRRVIIRSGLRPFLDEWEYWNGFAAILPDGKRTFLTDGLSSQMGLMLREGYWPDLLDPDVSERTAEARRLYDRQARLERRSL